MQMAFCSRLPSVVIGVGKELVKTRVVDTRVEECCNFGMAEYLVGCGGVVLVELLQCSHASIYHNRQRLSLQSFCVKLVDHAHVERDNRTESRVSATLHLLQGFDKDSEESLQL